MASLNKEKETNKIKIGFTFTHGGYFLADSKEEAEIISQKIADNDFKQNKSIFSKMIPTHFESETWGESL